MLMPGDEAELAETIRSAAIPLAVRGGGTRSAAPAPAPALSVARLSGVVMYDPGALTLVVRAGTPVATVEALLASHGQRLAFEPMDHRPLLGRAGAPTMGGIIGLNVSGPRRIAAGAARDAVLGVRLVDGRGVVIRNGGRVMKNVTGYDLARLVCGARGRLGVVTEIALKVLPAPARSLTLTLPADDPRAAVAALSAALASPWEVTGAAWRAGAIWLRIEGFAEQVAYRAGRLAGLFPGLAETDDDPWPAIRDLHDLAGQPGDVWRASLRPSHGAEAAARLRAAGAAVMLDWGGGLVWALTPPGLDARAALAGLGGHATRLRGAADDPIPALPPEAPAVAALSDGLRRAFDPRGIFAEG